MGICVCVCVCTRGWCVRTCVHSTRNHSPNCGCQEIARVFLHHLEFQRACYLWKIKSKDVITPINKTQSLHEISNHGNIPSPCSQKEHYNNTTRAQGSTNDICRAHTCIYLKAATLIKHYAVGKTSISLDLVRAPTKMRLLYTNSSSNMRQDLHKRKQGPLNKD